MTILRINTMDEKKFLQLSSENKLLSTELNIVDDDNTGRTNIPSYDLFKNDIHYLSTALKDIKLKTKDSITIGELYDVVSDIVHTYSN